MRTAPRRIRGKLESGDKAYGITVQLPSPEIVEAVGYAGYDFAWIDAEHGAFDFGDIRELIRAADAVGIDSLVRVAGHDPTALQHALDLGASGIIAPDCPRREAGSRDRLSSAFCTSWHSRRLPLRASRRASQPGLAERLSPDGRRCPHVRHHRTPCRRRQTLSRSRAREGLTGSCSAPYDLAMNLGLGDDMSHPGIVQMHNRVIEATRAAGIEYVTPNAAWESDLAATGSRIIPVAGDRAALISTFMRLLAESGGRPMPATAIA